MKNSALKWLWLSLFILLLDQIVKQVAVQYLELHQPLAILPGLNMTLLYNKGAAFSFLNQAGGWQRWFFIILALGVSIYIIFWLSRLPATNRWFACALALIMGGAIGNAWDRVVHGYVVDFIDVYYRDWHWPAFNVADSAITVGAIMIIIEVILFPAEQENQG